MSGQVCNVLHPKKLATQPSLEIREDGVRCEGSRRGLCSGAAGCVPARRRLNHKGRADPSLRGLPRPV